MNERDRIIAEALGVEPRYQMILHDGRKTDGLYRTLHGVTKAISNWNGVQPKGSGYKASYEKVYPAYSTDDHAALEGIKALPPHFQWDIHRLLQPKNETVFGVVITVAGNEFCGVGDSLAAAFADAMTEEYEYDLAYTDDCEPHVKKPRLRPAIAEALAKGKE